MKKFRVAEIFGPTIQGEGRHVGVPCYFIRFGGCDYRCVWCDSPHAVLPGLVAELPAKTEMEIVDEVNALPGRARWIVYSGGNPALLDLELLSSYLLGSGYSVMMETQGTVWWDWIYGLDEICVSPKPPSSQNPTKYNITANFLSHFAEDSENRVYLKVPIFDDVDYAYARDLHEAFPPYEMFLSVGNVDPTLPTVGNPTPQYKATLRDTQTIVLNKTRWLMEKVANDPAMRDTRVFAQQHVLAWGNQRGR
jgi:7-carboxy-7-deazaguanine synthase